MNQKEYLKNIEDAVKKEYSLASEARKKGMDFSEEPEIYLAKDVAEKVEGLIEIKGIAETIKRIQKETKSEDEVALRLASEVAALEKNKEKAAELAIRASLAFLTQGAVAAPLEGIAKVKIKKNPDNTDYLSIYFAGPIRAAGGTAEALSIVVADYVRKILSIGKYQPTVKEVGRYSEEIQWYKRYVRLQYTPSEDEIETIVRNVPVCIDGEPTEDFEVQNYRNLMRVETNRVRGGMCLVIAEGIAQKAQKLLKRLEPLEEKYGLGWQWLKGLVVKKASQEQPKIKEKLTSISVPGYEWVKDITSEDAATLGKIIEGSKDITKWQWLSDATEEESSRARSKKYLEEIPAGRPVFAYPSKKGGFSLRYGRTRASGYSAVAIHPATMHVLGDFIAIGTQIRPELPGKAAIVTPCDSINGPVVKLKDGEILQINSIEDAKKYSEHIEKIIHIGDILISAGDFIENNHQLLPPTFCEEWWAEEVKKKIKTKTAELELEVFINKPYKIPSFHDAFKISKEYDVPLHPAYTFFWHEINTKQLKLLANALSKAEISKERIILQNDAEIKKILEVLGVFHKIENNKILIREHAEPLSTTFNLDETTINRIENLSEKTKDTTKILSILSGINIKKKAPTTIGARMGRPEKAKPRKMEPAPHVLFPSGGVKGRVRNIVKIATTTKTARVDTAKFICPICNTPEIFSKCKKCGSKNSLIKKCLKCGRATQKETCPVCSHPTKASEFKTINISELLESALKNINEKMPQEIKGVIGMTSKEKIPEPLEKGILRAKHNVYVFKDGTIRFDSTNAPLTHFKPKEVGTSIKKLKDAGYTHDVNGNELLNEEQLLELKSQDIILSDYGSESASSYLLNTSKFIDELLVKYYKLSQYYNAKTKEDLVGRLVIALAPHTSTGIIGRIIGFSKARVGFAHPCFHDAKRRDCDGDEDAVMLLLDALLNFSRSFLPSKRGGRMDAPLVITTELNPLEIDDEVYDVDITPSYPLSFYEAAEKSSDPNKIKIRLVKDVIHNENPFSSWYCTHETSDINNGVLFNTYSGGEMISKLEKQLELAEKIRAVDADDVAERVIISHFLPDMKGNLKTFSKQKVRCTKCNAKFRRPPLKGICTRCNGNLTLTVHKGTIEKYLNTSKELLKKYRISQYTAQQIELLSRSIESIFGKDAVGQATLKAFK